MSECLFCRIVAGEIPADIVYSDEDFIAFRDISPQAPVHVLVIPRDHFGTAAELAETDAALAGGLVAAAARLADEFGIAADGYRIVANTGDQGGQTVPHVHLHLLGGRPMTWPPG
jgi:histidine triad (HIT) family protein